MALFSSKDVDGFHIITCPEHIRPENLAEMELEMKQWLINPAEFHVFHFQKTSTVDNSSYRVFAMFARALKTYKKQAFSIHVNDNLLKQFTQDGMDLVFNANKTLDDVKKKVTKVKKNSVNVAIINPFVAATQNVLGTQASVPVHFVKPFLKEANSEIPPVDIVGVVQVNCEEFKGSIALCFPSTVFLAIYEKMVGEKHTTITPEIEDGAGELLNMIFGQVKTDLNAKGFHLHMAIPTVLAGEKLRLNYQNQGTTMILPFESGIGKFRLEIVIVDNE